jgi:NurA-like 5'-3' nuclease
VGGYPYVLARAHELALISTDERRDLEEMVVGALRRRGLDPRPSEKAWQKGLTGGAKRRHRL